MKVTVAPGARIVPVLYRLFDYVILPMESLFLPVLASLVCTSVVGFLDSREVKNGISL